MGRFEITLIVPRSPGVFLLTPFNVVGIDETGLMGQVDVVATDVNAPSLPTWGYGYGSHCVVRRFVSSWC